MSSTFELTHVTAERSGRRISLSRPGSSHAPSRPSTAALTGRSTPAVPQGRYATNNKSINDNIFSLLTAAPATARPCKNTPRAALGGEQQQKQQQQQQQKSVAAAAAATERHKMALTYVVEEAVRFEVFGDMEKQRNMLRRDVRRRSLSERTEQHTRSNNINMFRRRSSSSSSPPPFQEQQQQQQQQQRNSPSRRKSSSPPLRAAAAAFRPASATAHAGDTGNRRRVFAQSSSSLREQQEQQEEAVEQYQSRHPVEMSASGRWRCRLTIEQERKHAEDCARTWDDVSLRMMQNEQDRRRELEQRLAMSELKNAHAERWRGFDHRLRRAQQRMLWSTLLLAVVVMKRWHRECVVFHTIRKIAASVTPMIKWRRICRQRRAAKENVLCAHKRNLPPLTSELLMTDVLLRKFGPDHLRNIVPYARIEAFLANDTLMFFREPARTAYILVHGELAVLVGRGVQVALLRPPCVVGAIGMVTKGRRNARLTCRTDVIVYVIDHYDFIKEKPSLDVMRSASLEAQRLHLNNCALLYKSFTTSDSVSRYYTMAHIPEPLLAEMCKKMKPQQRRPGEYIIRAGERSSSLFFLFEGRVDICVPQQQQQQQVKEQQDDVSNGGGAARASLRRSEAVEKALAMIDVLGPSLQHQRLSTTSRKQRLMEHDVVIPASGDVAGLPSSSNHQQHPPGAVVSITATPMVKFMIGGPRFFLLDLYDMNAIVVRSAVDIFELTRDDFLSVLMQRSPASLMATRNLCMQLMSETLEPPPDHEIAAVLFGEPLFNALRLPRKALSSGDLGRRLFAPGAFVIPAGTSLSFDMSKQDVLFVMRGDLSRSQRRKENMAASGSLSTTQQRDAADSTENIHQQQQQQQRYLLWPTVAQCFYSNQSYTQIVARRLEGFRVSRGDLLQWIVQALGADEDRWKLFRAAMAKPHGGRPAVFNALNVSEKTVDILARRGLLNTNKILQQQQQQPSSAAAAAATAAVVAEAAPPVFSAPVAQQKQGSVIAPPTTTTTGKAAALPHRPLVAAPASSAAARARRASAAAGHVPAAQIATTARK